MQAKLACVNTHEAIGIAFTGKPVTPWGESALFVTPRDHLSLAAKLLEVLPFALTSSRRSRRSGGSSSRPTPGRSSGLVTSANCRCSVSIGRCHSPSTRAGTRSRLRSSACAGRSRLRLSRRPSSCSSRGAWPSPAPTRWLRPRPRLKCIQTVRRPRGQGALHRARLASEWQPRRGAQARLFGFGSRR